MICDVCGKRAASLFDRVVENGKTLEYAYCEACYTRALKEGIAPSEAAKERIARKGMECGRCGTTKEQFESGLFFGCPDCYRDMREVARAAIARLQTGEARAISSAFDRKIPKIAVEKSGFKTADECTAEELTRDAAISSRIRLARNVEGRSFPRIMTAADMGTVDVIKGAVRAAEGIFDARILTMSGLNKAEKKLLLEKHLISLPLANNDSCGAVIIEKGDSYRISVMVNEEDCIREQCVADGHSLRCAYEKLHAYDLALMRELPIAYDREFGFLTACPTNVGTGMRASQMLCLPALERTEAIDDVLKTFGNLYGLTVRGYFGEGSGASYGMYQVSNARTYGISEKETVELVISAVERICYLERVALEKLFKEHKTPLLKGIRDSYGRLAYAYSLTLPELLEKLADVRLGVILGELPVKNMAVINMLIERCITSPEITTGGISDEERCIARANIVRKLITEEK